MKRVVHPTTRVGKESVVHKIGGFLFSMSRALSGWFVQYSSHTDRNTRDNPAADAANPDAMQCASHKTRLRLKAYLCARRVDLQRAIRGAGVICTAEKVIKFRMEYILFWNKFMVLGYFNDNQSGLRPAIRLYFVEVDLELEP